MNSTKSIASFANKVQDNFDRIFDPHSLRDLAQRVGFVQRKSSRLKGDEFVRLLTISSAKLANQPLSTWTDELEKICSDADMTPQALCYRINSAEGVNLLKAVFAQTMQVAKQPIRATIGVDFIDSFSAMVISDSTICTLPKALADHYPGAGGCGSEASLKILHAMNMKTGTLLLAEVFPGSVPDQKLGRRLVDIVPAGGLLLADLGLSLLDQQQELIAKDAFFLSRMNSDVAIFSPATNQRLNPIKFFNRHCRNNTVMDQDVLLGVNHRIPCRLIATRVPKEVYQQRLLQAKRKAATKGRTVSEEHKNRLKFSVLVSNVERYRLPAAKALDAYMIRWQEELNFKVWKSLLHINALKGERIERIESLVFGRLTLIILISMATAYAYVVAKKQGRQLSTYRFVNWLQQDKRLLLFLSDLDKFTAVLLKKLKHVVMELRRKRKTTLEVVATIQLDTRQAAVQMA